MPFQESEELVDVKAKEENTLVLFNDDVNTFDFVIESLVEVCNHDRVQAEQCSIIVHYKGKCSVQSGTFAQLEPMCTALHDRGLSASID
ncbi:MAG: ATP-dependent Clp protease adaptor ClpS [Bacteroidia bacterium]|nr:ATP-dependent Clp protease adaptor ClpS [Bacteroidia bacterium]